MTVAEWCVFGTVMLYLLTIAPFKAIGFRRFDNSKARPAKNFRHRNSEPAAIGNRPVERLRKRACCIGGQPVLVIEFAAQLFDPILDLPLVRNPRPKTQNKVKPCL